MKVFAHMPTPGGLTGAPRRLLTLASVLREQGIEMCIATQRDSELFRAAEEEGLDTVEVETVGVLRERQGALFYGNAVFRVKALFSLLGQNLGIARKIRRQGADVVWVRGSKGVAYAGLGALLSRRHLVWDVDYELPSRGPVRWLHRFGLGAAKHVIFQYSAAPEVIFGPELATRYRHKFQAIIPGVDLPSLEPFRAKRMARERRESDPFVMLQVGTICDRKNQATIIEALRSIQITEGHKNKELWLAYDEIQDRHLLDRVKRYGLEQKVKFLGWRDDVKAFMAEADILVMPSRDEGVPNAVQEAMAIGVPVLASEAGGMPEIIRDGQTGWILGMDDPEEWAARIQACAHDRSACQAVGDAASAYARDHFGTAHWGQSYSWLLEGVVSSPDAVEVR
jgi:glycosyltransferase involved in cell wall biosynthesis